LGSRDHRHLHSLPTRRSSDLFVQIAGKNEPVGDGRKTPMPILERNVVVLCCYGVLRSVRCTVLLLHCKIAAMPVTETGPETILSLRFPLRVFASQVRRDVDAHMQVFATARQP